eukprot:9021832-Pyramimonas_sp.AAC.1
MQGPRVALARHRCSAQVLSARASDILAAAPRFFFQLVPPQARSSRSRRRRRRRLPSSSTRTADRLLPQTCAIERPVSFCVEGTGRTPPSTADAAGLQ